MNPIFSSLNLALIGLILGGFFGLFWMNTSNSKKDSKKIYGWIAMAGLVVAIAGMFAVPSLTNPLNGVTTPSTGGLTVGQTSGSGTTICAVEDTTVTLTGQDKYTGGATGGTHRYRINGAPALTVSDAGTLTASPGNSIEVLWSNASLTGYLGQLKTYEIPCKGTVTLSEALGTNGSITSTEFNSNGQVINGGTFNQTLAAGDIKDAVVRLSGTYKNDFSHGFVAVIEYNKTALDDITLTIGGTELPLASVPNSFNKAFAGVSTTKAYDIPALISNENLEFKVTIDADDAYNPGAASTENITIQYFPKNYYIDDKNGGAIAGPAAQDESQTLTRTGAYVSTIYYD